MKRPRLATAIEIEEWCREHPSWTASNNRLSLSIAVPYRLSGALAAATVPLADEIDHHPIVTIGYNSLEVELWTHDKGGITALDFRLATFIDEFLAARR